MHGFERAATERGRWLGAPQVHDIADLRRIAVVRALGGLGDLLCLVPALRSLRAGAPAAHVTCVGVPAGRWLLERYPHLVDAWIDLPSWPTVPEADGDPADTGVAHLGVAVDVPTLVVGATTDQARWGPMDQRRHATVCTTGQASVDLAHVTARLDRMLADRRHRDALAG